MTRGGSQLARAGRAALGALAVLVAAGAGCADGCAPAKVTCPPEGTTLTYRTFGKSFFSTHCVRCHGGADTFGEVRLTTLEEIRARNESIYANAAGDNALMPPGPEGPSVDDRRSLAEWLSCGAP